MYNYVIVFHSDREVLPLCLPIKVVFNYKILLPAKQTTDKVSYKLVNIEEHVVAKDISFSDLWRPKHSYKRVNEYKGYFMPTGVSGQVCANKFTSFNL